jgi:hypothetical protein
MCAPVWFDEFIGGLSIDRYKAGLDHQRHYGNVAVFQPYKAEGRHLLSFLSACEAAGLSVDISGISNYWPGTTFRIAVYRPEDEAEFQEYVASITNADGIVVPTEEDSVE